MKYLVVIVSMLLLAAQLQAQEVWLRSYGGTGDDFGRTVAVVPGGYIVAGSTNSFFDPSTDVYVLHINEQGDYVWGRNYGAAGFIEWAVASAIDPNGDIILAGYTDNSGGNGYDGLLMKINADGDLLWMQHYGGPDWDFFHAVSVDEAGMIYAGGETQSGSGSVAWLTQIDSDGNLIWESTLPCLTKSSIEGIDHCGGDTLIYAGTCYDAENVPHMLAGVVLNDGSEVWQRSDFEFEEMAANGCRCGLEQNMLIIANRNYGPENVLENASTWMSLTLDDGEAIWTQIRFSESPKEMLAINQKPSGNILLTGKLSGEGFAGWDVAAIELQSNGFEMDGFIQPLFGGSGEDISYDLVPTPDDGYILVGETSSFGNNYQVLVAKVGPDGAYTQDNVDYLDLITTVAYESPRDVDLQVFPNPAKDQVKIQWSAHLGAEAEVEMLSLDGKLMFRKSVPNSSEINLPALSPGMYLLKISNARFRTISRVAVMP